MHLLCTICGFFEEIFWGLCALNAVVRSTVYGTVPQP
jgi:hypothetical protein